MYMCMYMCMYRCMAISMYCLYVGFNFQNKLLQHTPVMDTHSIYELGGLSRTAG